MFSDKGEKKLYQSCQQDPTMGLNWSGYPRWITDVAGNWCCLQASMYLGPAISVKDMAFPHDLEFP